MELKIPFYNVFSNYRWLCMNEFWGKRISYPDRFCAINHNLFKTIYITNRYKTCFPVINISLCLKGLYLCGLLYSEWIISYNQNILSVFLEYVLNIDSLSIGFINHYLISIQNVLAIAFYSRNEYAWDKITV